MNTPNSVASASSPTIPNGSGAAAILAAGIGSFVLAVLNVAGDKSAAVKSSLIFYKPTGPLSGATTAAILVWLVTWEILDWRWRKRTVAVARINAVAMALLGVSLMLTFPPIVDLF